VHVAGPLLACRRRFQGNSPAARPGEVSPGPPQKRYAAARRVPRQITVARVVLSPLSSALSVGLIASGARSARSSRSRFARLLPLVGHRVGQGAPFGRMPSLFPPRLSGSAWHLSRPRRFAAGSLCAAAPRSHLSALIPFSPRPSIGPETPAAATRSPAHRHHPHAPRREMRRAAKCVAARRVQRPRATGQTLRSEKRKHPLSGRGCFRFSQTKPTGAARKSHRT
jgi:hypothetical protein